MIKKFVLTSSKSKMGLSIVPGFENNPFLYCQPVQLFAAFGKNADDAFGLHVVFYRNGIPADGPVKRGVLQLKAILNSFYHLRIGKGFAAQERMVNGFGKKLVCAGVNVQPVAGTWVHALYFACGFRCWHNYRFC